MFGMDEFGKTVCIFVKGFNPFFYVKVPDDWTQSLVTQFVDFIKAVLSAKRKSTL